MVLDKYTIVEAQRAREVYNWQQHFTQGELQTFLTEMGVVVEKFYGNVAGSPFSEEARGVRRRDPQVTGALTKIEKRGLLFHVH